MAQGRKPNMLNVKQHLCWIEESIQDMLEEHEKGQKIIAQDRVWRGIVLPPLYTQNLRKISLLTRAILKKHSEKGTRKDIYVPRS